MLENDLSQDYIGKNLCQVIFISRCTAGFFFRVNSIIVFEEDATVSRFGLPNFLHQYFPNTEKYIPKPDIYILTRVKNKSGSDRMEMAIKGSCQPIHLCGERQFSIAFFCAPIFVYR